MNYPWPHHRSRIDRPPLNLTPGGIESPPARAWAKPALNDIATMTLYWKLEDGTGLTAQDATANNNDGTLAAKGGGAVPMWIDWEAAGGGGLSFAHGEVDGGTAYRPANTITIALLFNPTDETTFNYVVSDFNFLNSSDRNGWAFAWDYDNGGLRWTINNGASGVYHLTATLEEAGIELDGGPYLVHLVYELSPRRVAIYVNGAEIKTADPGINLGYAGSGVAAPGIHLGVLSDPDSDGDSTYSFRGDVAWLAVYAAAFDDSDAAAQYAALAP